jgi:hypothetical protein
MVNLCIFYYNIEEKYDTQCQNNVGDMKDFLARGMTNPWE